MNRTVLVVLLAFLAGGAIGFVAGSSSPDATMGPRMGPASAGGEGPAAEPETAVPEDGGPDEGPAPGAPRGTGEIRGRVRTEAGDGVAGVRVTAEEQVEETPLPEGASLAEETRILRANRARVRAGRVTAESGLDGAFLLAGLADAKYRLRAEREGYEFSGPGLGRFLRPGRTAEIVATAVVGLTVRVLMPDGSAASKARVEMTAEDRDLSRSAQWKPDDPVVTAPPGTWRAKAVAGEGDELSSPPVLVTLSLAGVPDPLTLALVARPGIRGRVTPPKTWPAGQWLTVAALRAAADVEPPGYERLSSEGRQAGCGEDSDYTFSFPDLKPGTYHLAALGNWQQVLARAVVEVADRMVVKDLVAEEVPRAGYIVVRAEGPDGRPAELTGAMVLCTTETGDNSWGSSVARLPDGTWSVDFPQEEAGARVQRRAIVLSSPTFGEKEVEFTRTEATEVTVRFDEAAWIDVEVSGQAELEDGGSLRVAAIPEGRSSMQWSGREISEDGKARVGPLQAGTYRVRLFLQRPRGEVPVADQSLSLRAGTNRLVLRIPPLYDLAVTQELEGEGRFEFYLSMPDEQFGWGVSGEAGPDGRVTFRGLPAGKYQLWGWRGDGENSYMEIVLPGATVVRFEPRTQNALRVTVKNPDGVLGRAGLQTGDLVTGIDGIEFEGGQHMFSLLQAAVAKKAAKFTVLRGGETLTLDVSSGEARGNWDWGGSLDPAAR